jgi:phage portal protein BeeE
MKLLGERILDAVDTLRGDNKALTTLGVSGIRHEKKSAPDMGRNSYGSIDSYRPLFPWRERNPDQKRDLGSLDGHSLVMCVVNYTGTRLPEAKPTVLKKDRNGKLQPDPLHDLARLIRRPNLHFVWANYTLAISVSWWIDGNVYFLKDRDITGTVQQIWYIPHYMMRPRWYGDGRAPGVPQFNEKGEESSKYLSHYQYDVPGFAPVLYPASEILHIKRGCDALRRGGVSGFEPLITELYGDNKMAQFTAAIMTNMGIQVPVISPKDKEVTINPTDAAAMKESWIRKTTGPNAGEPVIMTEPIDVEKFGFSPKELDLSALRMIPESRVAAVLGIPAPTLGLLVGLQNGTSYASSEQARQQGYEEVVIPMQRAIAEEIQWQLLPEFEDPEKAEFSFDTSEVRVLQEDRDALFKRESEVTRVGGQTINQYLTSIGKEAVNGGDIFLIPRTSLPLTLETLKKIAADPTVLQAAMPAEQALGGPSAIPAKFADIDRTIAYLEEEMKNFNVVAD